MTRAEYEKRLNDLAEEISELRHTVVEDDTPPKPPHPRWRPACGEWCYFINKDGMVFYGWNDNAADIAMYETANLYKSERDDVRFAVERQKVLSEIDEWRGEYGDPVSIAYYENDGKVESVAALYPNRGEAVFANYEDADGCIRAIGQERLKKYYFRVSEEDT